MKSYKPSSESTRRAEQYRRNLANVAAWYARRVQYLTGRTVQEILRTAVTP